MNQNNYGSLIILNLKLLIKKKSFAFVSFSGEQIIITTKILQL